MVKIKDFVRLDFKTIKPYLTIKNLLIFSAVAIYMALVTKNISSGIGIGMMLATLYVAYPFATAEKVNMDALYITLGLNKKMIVKGRYFFALLIDLFALIFSAAFSYIILIFIDGPPTFDQMQTTFIVILGLLLIFIFIQLMQIPIYFKYGYTRAKFISIMPFFILSGALAFFTTMINNIDFEKFSGLLNSPPKEIWLFALLLCFVMAGLAFISFRISLIFYKKREF